MDPSLLFSNETAQIVISVLLAAFGGAARLLSQKEKFALRTSTMLTGCFVSSFTGVLAYFTVSYFNLAVNILYITAGICGWLGPQVINVFANLILQSAGLNLQMINEQQLMLNDLNAKFIDDEVNSQLTAKRQIKSTYKFEEPDGFTEPLGEQFDNRQEEPAGWLTPLEEPAGWLAPLEEPADWLAPLEEPAGLRAPLKEPAGWFEPLEEPINAVPAKEPVIKNKAPSIPATGQIETEI